MRHLKSRNFLTREFGRSRFSSSWHTDCHGIFRYIYANDGISANNGSRPNFYWPKYFGAASDMHVITNNRVPLYSTPASAQGHSILNLTI